MGFSFYPLSPPPPSQSGPPHSSSRCQHLEQPVQPPTTVRWRAAASASPARCGEREPSMRKNVVARPKRATVVRTGARGGAGGAGWSSRPRRCKPSTRLEGTDYSPPDTQAMAKPLGRGGGGGSLLDLEWHFASYGAYHSNPVNVAIHALFVWPIFLTAVLLVHLAAPFPHAAAAGAALYGAFYVLLDRRAGALAALLCFLCWAASAALASRLGYSAGCKVVLVAQLFCWTMQFIGHGVFEKRAPALLDNLVQAFLMAPFFVLLEVLHKFAGYEPYPGFHANVGKLVVAARKEWQDKKAKKMS